MTTRTILLFLLAFNMPVPSVVRKDLYVAASAHGDSSGEDCSNAMTYSFFDEPSSWGTGIRKISPGTTIHICGVIAVVGSGSPFEFQQSGTADNPITLRFEKDAVVEAPYWGMDGAISCHHRQYIVVDGGTNGMIQATANGSNLANQKDGAAIHLQDCSNSELKNLIISNIYVHDSPSDENGQGTYGVFWDGGSNVQIHNNSAHDAKWCLFYGFPGVARSSNISIFSNVAYNCDHDVVIGSGNTGAVLDGMNVVHDNVFHDWANWDDNANNNHHDGIHVWAAHQESQINNLSIYNNDCYGRPGGHMNSDIYIAGGPGDIPNARVFNNVMVNKFEEPIHSGFISDYGRGTHIYNNTMKGSTKGNTAGHACINVYLSGDIIENNICSTAYVGVYIHPNSSIERSDYNDFYDVNAVGFDGKNWCDSVSSWSRSTKYDTHSNSRDPQLTPTWHLVNSKSAAWRSGDNLSSLDALIPSLDKSGKPRPTDGPWDMGAYQDSIGGALKPALKP